MKSTTLVKKRIFALLIDIVTLNQLATLINNFVKLNFELNSINLMNKNIDYGFSLMFLVFIIYFFLFDFLNNGVTIGKKIIGISIKHSQNNIISNVQIYKRTFIKLISVWFFPISLLTYLLFGVIFQDLYFPKIITTEPVKKTTTN